MPAPPHHTSNAGAYVWTYPGCPWRILLDLEVVEQLRREVLEKLPQGREAGGLLVGTKRPGSIKIIDFIPLPAQPDSAGPHFSLSSDWLSEIVARCPSDRRIVGYYRTDIDQRVQLGQDDLDSIQRWFKDPSDVFLIIAPTDGPRASAGFFCWQGESVSANPRLTFPFSAADLASGEWPIEAGEPLRFGNLFSQATASVRAGDTRVLTGIAVLAIVMAVLITVLSGGRIGSTSAAPPGLGLQVKRDGAAFLITWNRSARPIANAKEANLVISDPSREPFDGTKDPLFLQVAPGRLRTGSMTYTSFSPVEKVQFRLDVVGPSGELTSESLASTPAPGDRSIVPPLEEPKLPGRSRPQTVRSSRAVDQPRTASRTFVPPISGKPPNLARTVIPAPPEIAADAPADPTPAPTPTAPLSLPFFNNAYANMPAAGVNQNRDATPAVPQGQLPAGVLTITSEPSGAEVQINAVRAGYTPLTIQISPVGLGFTVTVTKSGFMKWTLQTSATAQPYSLHAQLRPSPR